MPKKPVLVASNNDITAFYNFYFDADIERRNVFIGYERANMFSALTEKDFTWALITAADWKTFKDDEQAKIEEIYTINASEQFHLLTRK